MSEVFQCRTHTAATVVTTYDDVFDLENIDGVLQYSENIKIGFLHDVSDVAMHENFSGREAGDLVGRHAAIGASDPQVFRRLLIGKALEKVRVALDDRFGPVLIGI